MAVGSSTFMDFGGAVGDILGGYATGDALHLKAQGDLAEAQSFDYAAGLAKKNQGFEAISTAIKQMQQKRQFYLGFGQSVTDIAGSNLSGGSGLDVLRSSAEQGALAHQIIGAQGQMQEAAYSEQSLAYSKMAEAARFAAQADEGAGDAAERNGWITGGFKAAAGIATFF